MVVSTEGTTSAIGQRRTTILNDQHQETPSIAASPSEQKLARWGASAFCAGPYGAAGSGVGASADAGALMNGSARATPTT
jgi:hypothetical protein